MSYSSNSAVSAWYSFTRSSKSGSICFRYCTTSVCSTFESTSSESTLSEKRDRKSTRLNFQSRGHLVCRLLLEKKKKKDASIVARLHTPAMIRSWRVCIIDTAVDGADT